MDGFFVTLLKRKKEHIHRKLDVLKKRSHATTVLEKKKSKAKKKTKSKITLTASSKVSVFKVITKNARVLSMQNWA